MKIAIPLFQGQLSLHFGHCDQFAVFKISDDSHEILSRNTEVPPSHAPGALPKWLSEIGVDVIIAGGMGQRAQQLFEQNGIRVIVGTNVGEPEQLVNSYLEDSLVTGDNICDH